MIRHRGQFLISTFLSVAIMVVSFQNCGPGFLAADFDQESESSLNSNEPDQLCSVENGAGVKRSDGTCVVESCEENYRIEDNGCLEIPPDSLRRLAAKHGIQMGAAVKSSIVTNSLYLKTLGEDFSEVVSEYEMKMNVTRPQSEDFDFSAADKIAKSAIQNKQALHGHTLIWHNRKISR